MARILGIVSALGTDRVGIVEDLATAVAGTGANIEESRMAVLGGDFAVMMLVTLESEALDALVSRVPELERATGLRIGVKPTAEAAARPRGRPYVLEASCGLDVSLVPLRAREACGG